MLTDKEVGTKYYCNVQAIQKGLDPVGNAHDFADALIVETPLPWKRTLYEKAGTLPQEIIDLLQLWLKRYREDGTYSHSLLMVAPDHYYSQPSMRRVMYYRRPEGAFAAFSKIEYLVPEGQLGALARALHEAQADLPQFEAYRQPAHDQTRDLLVCTHGTVDAACAKFGYPLYKTLRKYHAHDSLRVWRVSHFGGHVFAPTLMDMPTGHYWAYVEDAQAEQIAQRSGDVRALYGHYRGWAGLDSSFLQAAERELWMQHGWDWFAYPKSGQVLVGDSGQEEPKWAEVQINYTPLDSSESRQYAVRVEVEKNLSITPSTDSDKEYPYPQYKLVADGCAPLS